MATEPPWPIVPGQRAGDGDGRDPAGGVDRHLDGAARRAGGAGAGAGAQVGAVADLGVDVAADRR